MQFSNANTAASGKERHQHREGPGTPPSPVGLGWLEVLPCWGVIQGTQDRDSPASHCPTPSRAALHRRAVSMCLALSLNFIRAEEQRVLVGGNF